MRPKAHKRARVSGDFRSIGLGKGSGRPKFSQKLSDWFRKRSEDLVERADVDIAANVDIDSEDTDTSESDSHDIEERPPAVAAIRPGVGACAAEGAIRPAAVKTVPCPLAPPF